MTKTSRIIATGIAATAAVAVATPASAQFFGGSCTREGLQKLADAYVDAQTHGEAGRIPMGNWVTYYENFEMASISTDMLSKPVTIDWHRALLDETTCRVSLEMIVTNPDDPYVIAVQFNGGGGNGSGFQAIVTNADDWLFNAKYTYEYARREDWSPIPEDKRNSRAELQAAADAYLNLFMDKSVEVPWGTPCNRLEGGIYTGRGEPDDSCNVGVPDNIAMAERAYVIDPVLGAVDVFLKMGPNERPDSHRFRIEDGKIRYVHTVTNCKGDLNCGFDPFDWDSYKGPKPWETEE